MRWIWLVVGVLVVAVGIVWTLQGLNILGGSAMSGHAIFAVLGPMVLALGLAVVGMGVWRRRVPAE